MAEGKGIGSRIREAAGGLRRRNETRAVRRQLLRCEDDLSEAMEKYGQACFSGSGAAERLKGEAAALKDEAEALTRRLDELRGVLRCPDCGTELDGEDAYCRACGRALRKAAAPAAQIVWPEE